jgi:hypothetical protein
MFSRKLMLIAIAIILLAPACSLTSTLPSSPISPQVQDATATAEKPIQDQPTQELPGTISGHVNYPSEFIPAQKVVAFRLDNPATFYSVETTTGQSEYSLDVPAGLYYVVAYLTDGSLSAGFTQMVPCGLSIDCTDHSLIPVQVNGASTTYKIDPVDWYAPEDTFPPMP